MGILDDAAAATQGARRENYGHPADNHGCTAAMWTAWLRRRYGITVDLDAIDVCQMNILQKSSRLAHNPAHRDSIVDQAGYAQNHEVTLERPERLNV